MCTGPGDSSATKSVQRTPLTLQGIHHVHCCHGLPLGMLSVSDGIPDNVLQEHLEHAPGLLIDEATDPLDATSSCQAPDSRFGNSLDVVTQHLAVPFSASFTQTLATFTTARHVS